MKRVFPFMRLPKLKELYTLTAHCFDDPSNFSPIDYTPLKNTSSLSTLAFDEAEMPPHDVFGALDIIKPGSLKHFRWSGIGECHSAIDSCIPPFQAKLGAALKRHKETLEVLELGVIYLFCEGQGHHANPFATFDSIRGVYGESFVQKWQKNRGPKDAIMLGSLKDFTNLKKLVIEANALIGHQDWAASPTPLVDLLPPNLEHLEIIAIPFATWTFTKSENELVLPKNRLLYPALIELLRTAPAKLPMLKTVRISYLWSKSGLDTGELPVEMYDTVRELSREAGIAFVVGVADEGETKIPYFMEQTKDRNPGRDF